MGAKGHRTRPRLESGISKQSRLEHSIVLTMVSRGLSCYKTINTMDRSTITRSEDNRPPKKKIKTNDA
jgi:hypothetical protein